MSSKKTSKTTSNSTQTNAPPDWTAPGLAQAAQMVTSGLSQIPAQHYSGQQVAYMSPQEVAAVQGAWKNTAGLAGQYADWMGDQLPDLSRTWDYQTELPTSSFDMGQLQDVNPVIEAALHPLYQQLTTQVMPGIKSSALDAGAYSGDRAMKVMPLDAIEAYTDAASRTSAEIGYENYRDFEDRRLSAWEGDQNRLLGGYVAETGRAGTQQSAQAQLMQAINDYVSGTLRNSASVGDLLKMGSELGVQNDQRRLDDSIARDKYASYSPFMGLDQATSLLTGLSGNYGTQTGSGTSKTTEKTGGVGEWIKGAVGLASMIGGAVTGNPLMMLGGAGGLGGIGGAPQTVGMDQALYGGLLGSNIFGGG